MTSKIRLSHFFKHSVLVKKALYFADLRDDERKKHLMKEDLEQIKNIKARINTGRKI